MRSLRSLLSLSLFLMPSALAAFTPGFPYGTKKVRGVNIGGWLVLEPWITPSLFNNTGDNRIIDEYTFGQYQNRNTAAGVLRNHWDTFITEADFREIAAAGLNHVRIPIGYWAYDVSGGEPFIQGQLDYLERAIQWASQYKLKVIVDLHGAPGSQNGFDNSGQALDYPTWHTKKSNIARTNAIIKKMAEKYRDNPTVVSIAPLNEPAGFKGDDIVTVTKQYWRDSYKSIRYPYGSQSQESNTITMIHDAFKGPSYWNGFMPSPEYKGVILDTHIYQIFSDAENQMSEDDHIQAAYDKASILRPSELPVVVGEWTPAATDCALWLNGRFKGSRYDGSYAGTQGFGSCVGKTGRASKFSTEYKAFLGKYWRAQASTFESAGLGWIQWTWKTEIADEWSYQVGLEYGWIPRNGDPASTAFQVSV